MNNLYWAVYLNLESELNDLMFDIYIDDHQLDVYSIKITDLLIRSVVEIEAIVKELYLRFNPDSNPDNNFKFDEDGLKFLEKVFVLQDKLVTVASLNSFQSDKSIYPFKKKEKRTGSERMTFSWNNAYQNLKHNRSSFKSFGKLKYLYDSLAALYLLNIYYKNQTYQLGKEKETKFPYNQGSSIFSVQLYLESSGVSAYPNFRKIKNFTKCVYSMVATEKTYKIAAEALLKLEQDRAKALKDHFNNLSFGDRNKVGLMDEAEKKAFAIEKYNSPDVWKKAIKDPKCLMDSLAQLEFEAKIIKEEF